MENVLTILSDHIYLKITLKYSWASLVLRHQDRDIKIPWGNAKEQLLHLLSLMVVFRGPNISSILPLHGSIIEP